MALQMLKGARAEKTREEQGQAADGKKLMADFPEDRWQEAGAICMYAQSE